MITRSKIKLHKGCSISLSLFMQDFDEEEKRPALRRYNMSAHRALAMPQRKDGPTLPVIVEAADLEKVTKALQSGKGADLVRCEKLVDGMLSVEGGMETISRLMDLSAESSVRTHLKKQKKLHLDRGSVDCRLRAKIGGKRVVEEDGTGVVVGIVDSGFDLSHPMFRDSAGKLRVEALLEQSDDGSSKEFTTAQLEKGWTGSGKRPGRDDNGHGTHVASIAAGSSFQGLEGIAPGATFVLVKTDFRNTDVAVKWIFEKAGLRPCVVNLSLGHHWGAHDGTDPEERLHSELTGKPGRIICVSAGNEREDRLHIGGRFNVGQIQTVSFNADDFGVPLILWHSPQDKFDLTLIAPDGSEIPVPATAGNAERFEGNRAKVEVGTQTYAESNLLQRQIQLTFSRLAESKHMNNWKLRLILNDGTVGRIDGWFGNSGFATFHDHPLVEQARTVGLSATGDGCIAVASHVSKDTWPISSGKNTDAAVLVGRSSRFSSVGPTRDGRWKPDISAPGQYITAALAEDSELSQEEDRTDSANRLLTIEGTSMASPMVTGIVALMLQKKPSLTLAQVRAALRSSSIHDDHTTVAEWTPTYGFGKIDVAKALASV